MREQGEVLIPTSGEAKLGVRHDDGTTSVRTFDLEALWAPREAGADAPSPV